MAFRNLASRWRQQRIPGSSPQTPPVQSSGPVGAAAGPAQKPFSRRSVETMQGPGSTPLPQPERVVEREARIAISGGPKVYNLPSEVEKDFQYAQAQRSGILKNYEDTKRSLDDALKLGTINQEQYISELSRADQTRLEGGAKLMSEAQRNSAVNRLQQGYTGVDPFGFGQDQYGNSLPQFGGTKFAPQMRPSAQARTRDADALLQSPLAGAMGRPGDLGRARLREINNQLSQIERADAEGEGGQEITVEERMARTAERREKRMALLQEKQMVESEERQREEKSALGSAATNIAKRKDIAGSMDFSSEKAGMGAAFADLPPEAQFLAPYLTQFQDSVNTSLQENADLTRGLLNKNDLLKDTIDRKLLDLQESYRTSSDAMQELVGQAKDNNQKYIQEQESAARQKLDWEEDKALRDTAKQKTKVHDALIAQIALAGGFGQDAGLRAVQESDRQYEERMSDLRMAFGLERADLSVKFTGLYTENQNKYIEATIGNLENLRNDLERLSLQGISNDVSLQEAENDILTKGWMNQIDLREKLADGNLDIASQIFKDIQDSQRAEAKAAQDSIIKTKDTIGFISDVSKEIQGNKVIADSRSVDVRFRALRAEYQRNASLENAGANFTDQELINLFNKMVDPNSVVRESEFARSAEGLSYIDSVSAKISAAFLGGKLNKVARTELFNAANTLNNEYQKTLQQELQPYIARANVFNSQGGLQTKVRLEDIIPVNLVALPPTTLEMWRAQMQGGAASPGAVGALPDFRSPPPMGFRTDRNNNPTAMTVDVAKTGGLAEGIDYVIGDKFPDSNLYTAKLLGDPVVVTIKAIDRMGFYTKAGGQRWTHTAMSKESWDSLSYNQKAEIVAQMYRREGGTGVLIAQKPQHFTYIS